MVGKRGRPMKCPYRKTTFDLKGVGLSGTEEQFQECYKEECPFYIAERRFQGGIIVPEYCGRANKELKENQNGKY